MGDGYDFARFKAAISGLSVAEDWEAARKEWRLVGVSRAAAPKTCLCGHFPLVDLCRIENVETGGAADIGSACAKRLLDVHSDLIFQGVKRVEKQIDKSLNADAAAFFLERGIIDAADYDFVRRTLRRRALSEEEARARRRINRKALRAFRSGGAS